MDGGGRELLLQGTEAPIGLGLKYAGTMFSTIRQRWNMNMVRLPASVARSEREPGYLVHVAELARRANQAGLFVILAAVEEGAALPTAHTRTFWTKWAAYFKDSPLVGFGLFSEPRRTGAGWLAWHDAMQPLVDTIRAAGSRQVIFAMVYEDQFLLEGFGQPWYLAGGNIVYEVCPLNRFHATDTARDRAFGFLSERVPLMAAGWDPELARDSEECQSVPRGPLEAAALVRSHLAYFDRHRISWSASSFAPGKLIYSMNAMEGTELYQDTVCGTVDTPVQGMGLEVQMHQWGMTRQNLISVSAGSGGLEVTPGGIVNGYALVTNTPEGAAGWPLPTALGGVSLRITDAEGVERMAPLLYAGLGSISYLIDPDTAAGMAQVELIRPGSIEPGPEGCIQVVRVAPGFFTATMNSRGPVVGVAVQRGFAHPLSECDETGCRSVPVTIAADGSTRLYLYGTGFRNATGPLRATIGGHHIHIAEAGPQPDVPYNDRLVLEPGLELTGLGEEDLVFWAGARVSNVVRVHLH